MKDGESFGLQAVVRYAIFSHPATAEGDVCGRGWVARSETGHSEGWDGWRSRSALKSRKNSSPVAGSDSLVNPFALNFYPRVISYVLEVVVW